MRAVETLLIQLPQLLHAAKGYPVKNNVIHPHHQRRRHHKLAPAVIDPIHRLRHRMGGRGGILQSNIYAARMDFVNN